MINLLDGMTAKEYLQQYLDAIIGISSKIEQMARLREMVTNTTTQHNTDRVQSMTDNKIERIVIQIVSIEEAIQPAIERLAQINKLITATIDSLQDSRYRDVLRLRYINGKKFEEICCILNYDYHYTCNIHGQALQEVQKIITNHNFGCDIV
jgi:hypothetical protein